MLPKSRIIDDGVPRSGVTNVGEVANTTFPVPVLVVTPVPPLFTAIVTAFHVPEVTVPSLVILS